ncbi:MAG: C1 family peptidase [Bacteroidetes bacterium]|nr:C1 family peptidase [Bacteroidota bacterium]MBS1974478.1 C1 family peptidase [Bacteroidota bacterium]
MAKAKKNSFRLGWVPDVPDHRDLIYSAPLMVMKKLPDLADLRAHCPSVYDQGQLGSCTANALAAAYEFDRIKEKKKDFMPSRLFIYYNERVIEHTTSSDSGAQIRDGIKTLNKQGVCPEKEWPYDINNFAVKPTANCYSNARKNEIQLYQRLDNTNLMLLKSCLSEGFPFVFGFTVYESFMSATVARTGKMPMPKPTEKVEGGHAVMAVGYNDAKGVAIVRNSWGTGWGDKGYFYMPYAYIASNNLCDDFWTIRLV